MAGKSKGRKSPQKRDKPVALVSADALTDEELLGRRGSGTAFTASLTVAVIVGIVAIVLARGPSSSSTNNERQRSPSIHAGIPAVFDHLHDIDSIPYRLFVKADFTDAVDGNRKLPPLPENAFQNPYDIIPALAKAISDNNVAVCMQLVQLLLNEEKSSPVGSTVATSQMIGGGFGQKGIEVSAQPGTATVHRNAMAYARLLWKSSEPFYFEQNLQLAHLRVLLVHKFFDIVFDERTTASSQSDKRRAIEMLGQALESRAELHDDEAAKNKDTEAAWKLYNGAVSLGIWGLPDQRPQHYFTFEESNSTHGDPFPSTDLYRGPVDILEKYWDKIRRELILHKKFPGKMDIDREHLAGGGDGARWLQADMLVHNKWDSDNVEKFPKTAEILKQIYDEYANDLPDAIMQMSTMTKSTRVRPHCGSGNHKVRLHLALYIPKGVGIRIANETDCWENGKVLSVDDSYVHSVWNDSNEPRTVLIVDVWKAGLTEDDREKVKRYFARRDRHLMAGSNQIGNS